MPSPLIDRPALCLFALTVALVLPVTGRAGDPDAAELRLSLGHAVRLALEKNPSLQQSANQVETGRINVTASA